VHAIYTGVSYAQARAKLLTLAGSKATAKKAKASTQEGVSRAA